MSLYCQWEAQVPILSMRSTGLHLVNENNMFPYCKWDASLDIVNEKHKFLYCQWQVKISILSLRSKYIPILPMASTDLHIVNDKQRSPYCHTRSTYLPIVINSEFTYSQPSYLLIYLLFCEKRLSLTYQFRLKGSCVAFSIFIQMLIEHSVRIKWRPWSNPAFRWSRSAMFAYVTQRGRKVYMG